MTMQIRPGTIRRPNDHDDRRLVRNPAAGTSIFHGWGPRLG
jgi:hypothetical protein